MSSRSEFLFRTHVWLRFIFDVTGRPGAVTSLGDVPEAGAECARTEALVGGDAPMKHVTHGKTLAGKAFNVALAVALAIGLTETDAEFACIERSTLPPLTVTVPLPVF